MSCIDPIKYIILAQITFPFLSIQFIYFFYPNTFNQQFRNRINFNNLRWFAIIEKGDTFDARQSKNKARRVDSWSRMVDMVNDEAATGHVLNVLFVSWILKRASARRGSRESEKLVTMEGASRFERSMNRALLTLSRPQASHLLLSESIFLFQRKVPSQFSSHSENVTKYRRDFDNQIHKYRMVLRKGRESLWTEKIPDARREIKY